MAFLFWPDSSEEQALANLRNLLFSLRRALPIIARRLYADRNSLQWTDTSDIELDILQFEAALTEADLASRRQNPLEEATWLGRAVDLYRGELLPSLYEDWVAEEREHYQRRFASALERLIHIYESEGDARAAMDACQRLLRQNPLHETVYKQLMELYAQRGMVAEALRVYHTCATTLDRELGVEPSADMHELYERLLGSRQSGQVAPPAQPAHRHAETSDPQHTYASHTPGLVGRGGEWALLQQAWREVSAPGNVPSRAPVDRPGRPRAALISGEVGIGKTRLAEELFNRVARELSGITAATPARTEGGAASARCYSVEKRLSFGPIVDWLRSLDIPPLADVWLSEISRLLPDLLTRYPGIPAPGPVTEAWQHRRLIDAICRVLAANQPLLLTLDDLQWSDPDTLECLHVLMRQEDAGGILLVMTARTEDLGADDTDHGIISASGAVPGVDPDAKAITRFLDTLRDAGQVAEIDLAPLNVAETATLAANLASGEVLERARIAELHRETEGNPLFIVEMLRAGWLEQGSPPGDSDFDVPFGNIGISKQLPPRMARALKNRLGQLSPQARKLLDCAAVIGRDFTLPLLRLASGEDQEDEDQEAVIVSAVDEMWRRRIVREQGEEGYDFSHGKLREVAYASLSVARRKLLHRRVAQALQLTYADNLERVSGRIASHYERAGLPARAAEFYRRAAEAARQLYANAEAIAFYRRALALADTTAAPDATAPYKPPDYEGYKALDLRKTRDFVAEVAEALGDILETTGDHAAARASYEKALAAYSAPDPLWEARILLKSGDTWRAQRDLDAAIRFYDDLDRVLGDEPYDLPERWWNLWIEGNIARMWIYYWLGDPDRLFAIAEKTRPALERYSSRLQKVKYYRCLTVAHLQRDRYTASDECMRFATQALAETRQLDYLIELVETTFLMGFCLLWRGDLSLATDHLQQSLALSERTGQVDFQLLSITYLGVGYRMQGDIERTRDTGERHLALTRSVQVPSYSETAHANLAWAAWKEDDLTTAEHHALKSLERPSPSYPFEWVIVWPLVAVSMSQSRLDDAVRYASRLLGTAAQNESGVPADAIRCAVNAWEAQQPAEAAAHLQDALRLAQERRFL
jgi:DNA-binding SARP family transcriptional activator